MNNSIESTHTLGVKSKRCAFEEFNQLSGEYNRRNKDGEMNRLPCSSIVERSRVVRTQATESIALERFNPSRGEGERNM